MRRRDFIAGLGDSAAALPVVWPPVTRARQRALPVVAFLNLLASEFATGHGPTCRE